MNTSAEEKLREIARQLVAAREAQGMPIEEIATKTFIPIRILKALEAAETFKLPEPIFVQGFIKRYAKLVGLDGDALAREIPLDQIPIAVNIVKEPAARALVPPINKRVSLDEPAAKRPRESIFSKIASSPVGVGKASASAEASRDGNRNAAPQEPIDRPVWLLPVLGGLASFGLVVGAIALMTNRPQPVTTTPSPSTSPSTKAKASIKPSPSVTPSESPRVEPSAIASPSPSPSPTSSPTSSPTPNLTTGPVNVVLNLSDDSWVEVKSDGKVVFEGTMAKGSNQNWSAQKEIEVTSGNAGAVTVSQNQKPGKVMGSAGDVKTTTFSGR